jgi:hypothetical protein
MNTIRGSRSQRSVDRMRRCDSLRAQNRLTVVGQVAQEIYDSPSTLRIEAGSRLVQKEKQFGLGERHHGIHRATKVALHTLAASSTPIVVRFLCSTPSVPTMASPYFSRPHILSTVSTLSIGQSSPSRLITEHYLLCLLFFDGY